MTTLMYFLKRKYYRYFDKIIARYKKIEETKYREKYISSNSPTGRTSVCVYQTNFSREYTRFFTSSETKDYSFYLVEHPGKANTVAFINTIDCEVLRPDQQAILFFHEPHSYAHLYQSEINEKYIPKLNVEVVSHLPSITLFMKNPDGIRYHRSIPYVHFHHMASYDQLNSIDESKRKKLICSIASGLDGIPGYQDRRQFFEKFSAANEHFDLFGKFSKYSSAISSYRGPSIFKWKTVSQYKYSLVIENSAEDYYISEKIFDALICGSMPIYYGNKKIFEVLPKEWFYYLPSLDDAEISKLNTFIATDAFRVVSNNRVEICKFIYEQYSFYSALESLLSNKPLPIEATTETDVAFIGNYSKLPVSSKIS